MSLIFKNKEHENNYNTIINMMKLSFADTERMALAYLFALNKDCFKHIHQLYDFTERMIIPEGLDESWQTSSSRKTTRLAFNLYNGWCTDGEKYIGSDGYEEDLPSSYYTPAHLFTCSDAPYFASAIKLRFSIYF